MKRELRKTQCPAEVLKICLEGGRGRKEVHHVGKSVEKKKKKTQSTGTTLNRFKKRNPPEGRSEGGKVLKEVLEFPI